MAASTPSHTITLSTNTESRAATIRGLPSEVTLAPDEDPIPQALAVNLDSIGSVSVGTLTQRLGRLSNRRMRQVCAAITVAVDGVV
jgi:mRNA interferase MazF